MKKLVLIASIVIMGASCVKYQEFPLEGTWNLETEINLLSDQTRIVRDTIRYVKGEILEILPEGAYHLRMSDRTVSGTWKRKDNGHTIELDQGSETTTDAHIQLLSEKRLIIFTLITKGDETFKTTLHLSR